MYTFLVTAHDGAWDLNAYEYTRDRFGEFTLPSMAQRFKVLSAHAIEELKSYPALFAYEGQTEDLRVVLQSGSARRIR